MIVAGPDFKFRAIAEKIQKTYTATQMEFSISHRVNQRSNLSNVADLMVVDESSQESLSIVGNYGEVFVEENINNNHQDMEIVNDIVGTEHLMVDNSFQESLSIVGNYGEVFVEENINNNHQDMETVNDIVGTGLFQNHYYKGQLDPIYGKRYEFSAFEKSVIWHFINQIIIGKSSYLDEFFIKNNDLPDNTFSSIRQFFLGLDNDISIDRISNHVKNMKKKLYRDNDYNDYKRFIESKADEYEDHKYSVICGIERRDILESLELQFPIKLTTLTVRQLDLSDTDNKVFKVKRSINEFMKKQVQLSRDFDRMMHTDKESCCRHPLYVPSDNNLFVQDNIIQLDIDSLTCFVSLDNLINFTGIGNCELSTIHSPKPRWMSRTDEYWPYGQFSWPGLKINEADKYDFLLLTTKPIQMWVPINIEIYDSQFLLAHGIDPLDRRENSNINIFLHIFSIYLQHHLQSQICLADNITGSKTYICTKNCYISPYHIQHFLLSSTILKYVRIESFNNKCVDCEELHDNIEINVNKLKEFENFDNFEVNKFDTGITFRTPPNGITAVIKKYCHNGYGKSKGSMHMHSMFHGEAQSVNIHYNMRPLDNIVEQIKVYPHLIHFIKGHFTGFFTLERSRFPNKFKKLILLYNKMLHHSNLLRHIRVEISCRQWTIKSSIDYCTKFALCRLSEAFETCGTRDRGYKLATTFIPFERYFTELRCLLNIITANGLMNSTSDNSNIPYKICLNKLL